MGCAGIGRLLGVSGQGLPLEEISRLAGHKSTAVTEIVHREQIRPVVLRHGAIAMDDIFKESWSRTWTLR
ncbi:hypothetical protein GCM10009733_109080 [Nonomuraea maheshkhaliensis]|uniref:Tyr recombinase domain-containing protein n=1 Tax=Nonomuraea maheshkhaliensis TaxID=419590 RepID=A0ABP4TXZ6_9ACTN